MSKTGGRPLDCRQSAEVRRRPTTITLLRQVVAAVQVTHLLARHQLPLATRWLAACRHGPAVSSYNNYIRTARFTALAAV